MEHGRALSGRVPLGQTLEGVEQHVVGVRHPVRREVALEHTPVGDAVQATFDFGPVDRPDAYDAGYHVVIGEGEVVTVRWDQVVGVSG